MNERNPKDAADRDDIGTLIRLAEPHRKVPAARAARVRAAAREQWVLSVERRRGRTLRWTVLAAAAMIAGLAFVFHSIRSGDSTPLSARIEQLGGVVESTVRDGGEWSGVAPGDVLGAETLVRTAATGRVSLRLSSGHSARIDHESEVRILDGGGLELIAGRIYLDSGRDGLQAPVDLLTPFGIVNETGTQYEARVHEGALRLRLREGSVVLHHASGDHTVVAGSELRVSSTNAPEIGPIDVFGESWGWVSAIAPVPDFQGRTAAEFLNWIAREKGWTIAFSGISVAEAARATVLQGDLGGFTPDEALQVVAATSRLRYTTEAGILQISAEE